MLPGEWLHTVDQARDQTCELGVASHERFYPHSWCGQSHFLEDVVEIGAHFRIDSGAEEGLVNCAENLGPQGQARTRSEKRNPRWLLESDDSAWAN